MAVKLPTAECATCRGRFAIRRSGLMREHREGIRTYNKNYPYLAKLCVGSGKPPKPNTQEGAYSYG